MSLVITGRLPRTRRTVREVSRTWDDAGDQTLFFGKALAGVPYALRRYKREIIRLIAEISMGSGALALIGGTVVIVGFLTLSSGGTIAIQGFTSLHNIGVQALAGFFSAYINVRIAVPVIAGIGLSATLGAGSTAQLGAMRIAEEIDALESMAIRAIPYVVSTRVVAGMIAIVPLYSVAVLAAFIGGRLTTVFVYGQSPGLYDHYFSTFLIPSDVLWSYAQVLIMALVVMLIHTYYGFTATGGPAGVGRAVGNAVRSSLIAVVCVTVLVSLAVYGATGDFNLSS